MIQNRRFTGESALRRFATICALMFSTLSMFAQQTIQGSVKDAQTLEPLVGATISVKGTAKGASTDANGSFSVQAQPSDVLVFTYVGFAAQEVTVGNRTTIEVLLSTDGITLNELAVTALGISREKKSLGYAVQEVSGATLDKARETNLVSSLAGKVAGLTIVGNPSGIGSSARITIRGERSLNINNNQPLFVVDGVPVSNSFQGSSGRNNLDADYGNGAGFINPDDIESISVLKGGSAAALYGSRGNNGVILITTKTGKNTRGLGVSVNSTLTFESVLRLPEYQDKYGQGLGGQFAFVDGNGGGTADGVDESWGPAFDANLLIPQFNSPTSNGLRGGDVGNVFKTIGPVDLPAQLAARGTVQATPWVAQPDNVRDFFETGMTQTHNLALTGSNDHGNLRVSYTWLDQTGIVPNTDLRRNTLSIAGGYNLNPRLKVRTAVNYIKNTSDNRPNLTYGTENIMYLFNCWLGRGVNMSSLRDYWMAGREDLNQFNFNYNYHDNPYFNVYENTNSQDIDRLYGNVAVTYDFNEHWSLLLRSGTDVSNELRARRRAWSTQRFQRGSYREENVFFQETNSDLLLSYKTDLTEKLSLGASAGGNLMRQNFRYKDNFAPELAVPGFFSLRNSRVALQGDAITTEKRINSVYGTVNAGFNNFLYLDVTGRNDWSSTLPSDSRSYFYYGANTSLVISELLKMQPGGVLSYLKVRAGVAQVGNDTDPYQLEQVYNAQTQVQGSPAFSQSSVLVNSELKPEISTSFETGFDVRFLNNRIGLDATYYYTRSKNQIVQLPLTNTSGYTARVINAGVIQNQGVEITLNLVPVQTPKFSWNVDFNFSANRSKVVELYTDPQTGEKLTSYQIASRHNVFIEAKEGERMGDMYGIGFARVQNTNPDAPYYDATGQFVGQVVYNTAGKPVGTASRIKMGNYNPDWLGGIYNTFRYKNLSLGVLFDMRIGGEVFSLTQTVGREGGQIEETLEGRADGYDLSKPGNGVIGEGVVQQADGTWKANDVKLSAREWHTSITLGRRLVEAMTYDASFVKLREARIGFSLPNRILGRTGIRDLTISAVGRNLFLWTDVPHIDPETSTTAGSTVIPGIESVAIPSTRSYGLNLNFRF